jgi:hypothetical protein
MAASLVGVVAICPSPHPTPRPVSFTDLISFKSQIEESYSAGTLLHVQADLKRLGVAARCSPFSFPQSRHTHMLTTICSITQLKKFRDKWKIKKNVPQHYKRQMIGIRRARHRVGKPTAFRYQKKVIPDRILDRFISDSKLSESELDSLEAYSVGKCCVIACRMFTVHWLIFVDSDTTWLLILHPRC